MQSVRTVRPPLVLLALWLLSSAACGTLTTLDGGGTRAWSNRRRIGQGSSGQSLRLSNYVGAAGMQADSSGQRLGFSNYVGAAGMQAGVLGAGSDVASQYMHNIPIDSAHVLAMASLACGLSGMANSVWMKFLEDAIPGGCTRAVSLKTLADFVLCASLFNSLFLMGVPYLTEAIDAATTVGHAPWPTASTLLESWTPDDFRDLMQLEACTFVPYNLCAFRMVPLHLRPVGSASLSALSTIVLSGITLGFGA